METESTLVTPGVGGRPRVTEKGKQGPFFRDGSVPRKVMSVLHSCITALKSTEPYPKNAI